MLRHGLDKPPGGIEHLPNNALPPARADVTVTGERRSWTGATDHRHFCGTCGSTLLATDDSDEIEIRIGSLDKAPAELTPDHELWVHRCEHWQAPLAGADQHGGKRS